MKNLSDFYRFLIGTVVVVTITVITFVFDLTMLVFGDGQIQIFEIFMTVVCVCWSIVITWEVRSIWVFRYKLAEGPYSTSVKYLGPYFLFIPYWSALKTKLNSYEDQNMFGAKYTNYYDTKVKYNSVDDALDAIRKHKARTLELRTEWFAPKDHSKNTVTYL